MTRQVRPRFQPRLETLEERCTPSTVHGAHAVTTAPAIIAGPSAAQTVQIHHHAPLAHHHAVHHTPAAASATVAVHFTVNGGGTAPKGLPVTPGASGPHNATGRGTLLGHYTGDQGKFKLLTIDPKTGTGTFRGSFVFVGANGNKLACNYGADPNNPGKLQLIPVEGGKVVAVFIARFTPDVKHSTGVFAKVTGGSFIMAAITEPFNPTPNSHGFTVPFSYRWEGDGTLDFKKS